MNVEIKMKNAPASIGDERTMIENLVRTGGLTFTDLVNLTKLNFRTIKKRLERLSPIADDDRSRYYALQDALPLLYPPGTSHDKLDLGQERAKLAREQTLRMQFENQRVAGELIDAKDAKLSFAEHTAAARARFLAIPSRVAAQFEGMTREAIEQNLKSVIEEALGELSAG